MHDRNGGSGMHTTQCACAAVSLGGGVVQVGGRHPGECGPCGRAQLRIDAHAHPSAQQANRPPAPPASSLQNSPPMPSSPASFSTSTGKCEVASHSALWGASLSRANASAISTMARCSSVSSVAIASTEDMDRKLRGASARLACTHAARSSILPYLHSRQATSDGRSQTTNTAADAGIRIMVQLVNKMCAAQHASLLHSARERYCTCHPLACEPAAGGCWHACQRACTRRARCRQRPAQALHPFSRVLHVCACSGCTCGWCVLCAACVGHAPSLMELAAALLVMHSLLIPRPSAEAIPHHGRLHIQNNSTNQIVWSQNNAITSSPAQLV